MKRHNDCWYRTTDLPYPVHLIEHLTAGRHHWGIVWLRDAQNIGQIAEALYLIWSASEAEEWIDRTDWLPW